MNERIKSNFDREKIHEVGGGGDHPPKTLLAHLFRSFSFFNRFQNTPFNLVPTSSQIGTLGSAAPLPKILLLIY